MDQIMKVLQELERNARAEMERQAEAARAEAAARAAKANRQAQPPAQRKRKQKRQEPPQQRLEAPDEALSPVAEIPTSAAPQVSQERSTSNWDRKRILDAFTLMQALGPPPGLRDDW